MAENDRAGVEVVMEGGRVDDVDRLTPQRTRQSQDEDKKIPE